MRLTNETWQERLRDLESEIYHRFVDHISKQVKKLIDHPLLQSLLCTGISPCECQLWILQPGTKTIKILQCAIENGYFWDTENVKQMGSKNLKTVFLLFWILFESWFRFFQFSTFFERNHYFTGVNISNFRFSTISAFLPDAFLWKSFRFSFNFEISCK